MVLGKDYKSVSGDKWQLYGVGFIVSGKYPNRIRYTIVVQTTTKYFEKYSNLIANEQKQMLIDEYTYSFNDYEKES